MMEDKKQNHACYPHSGSCVYFAVLNVFLGLSLFLVLGGFPAFSDDSVPRVRPANWAAPVIGSDLKNFHKVDDKLYRSEQPDDDDFKIIEKLGIKEVLNLRNLHSDDDEAKDTKLTLHHLRMNAGDVTEEELTRALAIIKAAKGPVLVHCWHGSDRTGVVVAGYRVIIQNWSKDKALDEMKNGGFGYHHSMYPNLIRLIQKLDVKARREKLGIILKPAANRETGKTRQP